MLKISIIALSSVGITALVTAVLLRFVMTRRILKVLQVAIIVSVIAYVAAFFVFYRPEIWIDVALELLSGATRVNVDVLTGLGGTTFGTLVTQYLLAGRLDK